LLASCVMCWSSVCRRFSRNTTSRWRSSVATLNWSVITSHGRCQLISFQLQSVKNSKIRSSSSFTVTHNKTDNVFELDDSGRRGHDQKLFNKRFRLDVRAFAFNSVVAND